MHGRWPTAARRSAASARPSGHWPTSIAPSISIRRTPSPGTIAASPMTISAIATMPSPTIPARSGSIPVTPSITTTAAIPTAARTTTSMHSPTTIRRSSSIRNSPSPISTAVPLCVTTARPIVPSPISTGRSSSIRLWPGLWQPCARLPRQGRPRPRAGRFRQVAAALSEQRPRLLCAREHVFRYA
jgi:hypothetical protein